MTGADDDLAGIPASIQLAWGRREPGSRGPKRGLTLQTIVTAGIKVALTEGVGSLSMARIAAELGVGTMSLYRYVAAKDDLLALMVDAALGQPPAATSGEDWRGGLRRWAEGVRDAYRRHPWSLRVPITGPPLGPNNVAWLENALTALAQTPLSEQEKLSSVLLVSGFVRNEETLVADLRAGNAAEPVMPNYGTLVGKLLGPDSHPALQRAIASGVLDDDDDIEVEFEFGIERILDGIAALVATKRKRPRKRTATP
ncbi:MAG: TetR/AcrR family transcriptional regulator [Solirubrobacteraceae bacterium]